MFSVDYFIIKKNGCLVSYDKNANMSKNSDKLLTFEYSKNKNKGQDISDNLMRCRFMKCTEKKEDAETVIRLKKQGGIQRE